MYDATLMLAQASQSVDPFLEKLNAAPRDYLLLTLHRAENTERKQDFDQVFQGEPGQIRAPDFVPCSSAYVRVHKSA